MDLNEIKTYLESNKEDPEVVKYLEQIADKRVNGALFKAEQKYKQDLESQVQERVKAQLESDRVIQARMNKIEQVFSGNLATYKEMGLKVMGEIGADTDEVFESKLDQTTKSFLKAIGSQKTPVGGNAAVTDSDVQAMRRGAGLATN